MGLQAPDTAMKHCLLHYIIQSLHLFGRECVVVHDEVVDRAREWIVDLTVLSRALLPCAADKERVFVQVGGSLAVERTGKFAVDIYACYGIVIHYISYECNTMPFLVK